MGTLLSRRRYMGGGSLPYDAELLYLESDGNARIVTDILFNSTTSIETRMGVETISMRTFPFGINGDVGNGYVGIDTSGYIENFSPVMKATNSIHTYYYSLSETKIDNVTADSAESTRMFGSPYYPLTFFSYQQDYNPTSNKIRFYSAIIKDNGVITHDIIPVRKGQTGCLYDKITNVFYYNDGSGDVVLSVDKPTVSKMIEIEYLQFTGTQFLNTEFVPNKDTSIELVVNVSAKDTYIFGSGVSHQSKAFEAYTYSTSYIETNYGNSFRTSAIPFTANNTFKIALDKNIALSYDMNGNELSREALNSSYFVCPHTLTIGALNRRSLLINTKTFNLGKVVLMDDDVIIRNYTPVRVNQIGYLYDSVSGIFFENLGTGSFTLGPDKT